MQDTTVKDNVTGRTVAGEWTPPTWPDDVPLTMAEGRMIEVLRRWQDAETDRKLYGELSSWEELKYYVRRYQSGDFTMEDSRKVWRDERATEYFKAIEIVASILPLFIPSFLRDAPHGDQS